MQSRISDAVRAFQAGDLARAREIIERELQVAPHSPLLQHLMGMVECRSGRIELGVEWLRSASASEPQNIAFRVMLVRALIDSGQSVEALEVATRPSGTSSAELAQWHARAEAADAAGDIEAAVEAWRPVASASPSDWRAWSNLGEALAKAAKWSDAADALSRAVQLNPNEPRIFQNLAGALGRSGEHERSAAAFEKLVRLRPDNAAFRLIFARELADLGRSPELIAELEAAAELTVGEAVAARRDEGLVRIALAAPGSGSENLRELALLLERTNRSAALRNLISDAEESGIAREQLGYVAAAMALRDGDPVGAKRILDADPIEADPMRWHRLMSKIADALGDTGTAFAEAAAMNAAVHDFDGWRVQGLQYRDGLEKLARSIAAWPTKPMLEPVRGRCGSPAFLVGFPRSGTTLADTFLMGHPRVKVLEEVPMLAAAEDALGGVERLPNASPYQLLEARDAYFRLLDQELGGSFDGVVIDKLPLNMTRLPLIHALFPDARIIFAQRHPCDAVLSAFMQGFVLNPAMASFLDISDAADLYDRAMNFFERSREEFPLQVQTLVYEELVDDPASALRPVIDFLRLDWRPELLDHRATALKRGAINTPSYDQVSEKLTIAPVGRWLGYKQELEPVLEVLMPWAEILGYPGS